jgi:hypothetical protein
MEANIIVVMNELYKKALAQEKTERIASGAFMIIDKGGQLKALLTSYQEAVKKVHGPINSICYDRSPDTLGSSHLLDTPKQFGMDFRDQNPRQGSNPVLPAGKKHLLWGYNDNIDAVFIKFEKIGCGTLQDQLIHGLHFIESTKKKVTSQDRIETDLKPEIKIAYLETCRANNIKPITFDKPQTFARFWKMLWRDNTPYNPVSISKMLTHLNDQSCDMRTFVAACTNAGYKEETLNHRVGNEVVMEVDLNEMAKAKITDDKGVTESLVAVETGDSAAIMQPEVAVFSSISNSITQSISRGAGMLMQSVYALTISTILGGLKQPEAPSKKQGLRECATRFFKWCGIIGEKSTGRENNI